MEKKYLDASDLEGNRVEKKYLDASEMEDFFYQKVTLSIKKSLFDK